MDLTDVELGSGRRLRMTGAYVSRTYANLLEGYPCDRINGMEIRALREEANRLFANQPIHAVPSRVTRSDDPPGAFGPVEILPAFGCAAMFTSGPIGGDLADYSELVVVWFQAGLPLALDEDTATEFRNLSWEELAADREW